MRRKTPAHGEKRSPRRHLERFGCLQPLAAKRATPPSSPILQMRQGTRIQVTHVAPGAAMRSPFPVAATSAATFLGGGVCCTTPAASDIARRARAKMLWVNAAETAPRAYKHVILVLIIQSNVRGRLYIALTSRSCAINHFLCPVRNTLFLLLQPSLLKCALSERRRIQ